MWNPVKSIPVIIRLLCMPCHDAYDTASDNTKYISRITTTTISIGIIIIIIGIIIMGIIISSSSKSSSSKSSSSSSTITTTRLKLKNIIITTPALLSLYSWVQSGGPVTTESIVRFDTWFEIFEVVIKNLAPMTHAKMAAEFVRSQNPKWPPVAILEM